MLRAAKRPDGQGPLARHFLLSAAARTLSLKTVHAEGEEAAHRRFRALRWPGTDGAPICPACGCADVHDLATRRRFKCAACHRRSGVTSGTIFASRKLAFVGLLAAMRLVANAAKGLSAVQLSRDLDVRHETAFVPLHQSRGAMAAGTRGATLSGEVEVDGAAFGGHARPVNAREDRVDRRLLGNRSGQRRRVGARHPGVPAARAAWLEDHRGRSNGALAGCPIGQALAAPVSRGWKGYRQRRAA
jgi:transposase-like protein